MHTNIYWFCRTLIVTYYQLLGNYPPNIVTYSSRFVSRFASVPGDGKKIHCLISLGKLISKRLHLCNSYKTVPMQDYIL